ncbi:MAG: ABC transporter ATP-binding protein [Defluviitoga tunisiensis]|jgi:peptide/nickel transport system ATP-binding protein|nr:ABC transporter ATP-binding protein [Defluviitoga tunisiensis]HHV01858.1 ABC transporter ATP-binding protein [Defluviitoga tunisiensis]HOP34420.1 ABC transporter ATP-binding protein [Defluviitoga tunisiensis]HPU60007.1 ABC transporter ATP-binding protein [Defluviitoga tunisiensis]
MSEVLTVNNLKLYYFTRKGVVKALDDVSFSLKEGETLGLVGESGCGKTTLGMGLLRMPSPPGKIVDGEIIIDNENIIHLKENELRKRIRWNKISMIFQGAMNSLTPVYNIKKQMLETLLNHREMEEEQALEIIKKYINYVGLSEDVLKRYPHELSGGMKQRVVIATALFLEPKIVIADEPTTALDVVVQAQIINLLKKLKHDLNLSFIFITHDLATEAEVADRIMVMYAGKIAEIGTNDQIYGKQGPSHPYTKGLLGATPKLREKVEELAFIPGTPPDLLNPPTGCRFHERCPVAFDKCILNEPPLKEIEPEHFVACWRCYDE